MNMFSSIRYEIIPSHEESLKEVMVTFVSKGKPHHYYIFLQKKGQMTDKDYIEQAKRKFSADYRTGKVLKSIKPDHSKPILITLACVFGAATLALAGFLIYKYFYEGSNKLESTALKEPIKEELFKTTYEKGSLIETIEFTPNNLSK